MKTDNEKLKQIIDESMQIFFEEFDICDNPDHGFIDVMTGIYTTDIGRLGCPTCDGDYDKKITVRPSEVKSFLSKLLPLIIIKVSA